MPPPRDDPSGSLITVLGIGILVAFCLGMALIYAAQPTAVSRGAVYRLTSTEGPFEAVTSDGGQTWDTGEPISRVVAGHRFAWINNLYVHPGVSLCIAYAFVHQPDKTVVRRTRSCTISSHDTQVGSQVGSWAVPGDMAPGHYELTRTGSFRTSRSGIVTAHFPSLPIEVEAGPAVPTP